MARELILMARQIVSALIGSRLTQAFLPSIVAYSLGTRYVTYYTQTQRIYEYSADIISRVGLVSAPRASDLFARGRTSEILELTHHANRYCLALWGALGSFLFVYGGRFCALWVNEEFGQQAAILLPLFGVGYMFFLSHFVTSAVLMGIGRYQQYSFAILAEAVLTIAAFVVVLRFSSLGPAVGVFSLILALNRSLLLSWLFAGEFKIPLREMWTPLVPPFALIAAACGLLLCSIHYWIPAHTWRELFVAATIHGCLYTLAAWQFVLLPQHRQYAVDRVRGLLARFSKKK
jgi:O-antigen/teichoic acid export membrane protein